MKGRAISPDQQKGNGIPSIPHTIPCQPVKNVPKSDIILICAARQLNSSAGFAFLA